MVLSCRANNSTSTVETLVLVHWLAYQHANNNALPTTPTTTQSRPNDCLLSGLFDSFLVDFYWNVIIQHQFCIQIQLIHNEYIIASTTVKFWIDWIKMHTLSDRFIFYMSEKMSTMWHFYLLQSWYQFFKTVICFAYCLNLILPRLLQRSKECRGQFSTIYHATPQWIMRNYTHLSFWQNVKKSVHLKFKIMPITCRFHVSDVVLTLYISY